MPVVVRYFMGYLDKLGPKAKSEGEEEMLKGSPETML